MPPATVIQFSVSATMPRQLLRHLAARADCDVRTLRNELTLWEGGEADATSPTRARARKVVRAAAARGELPEGVAEALGIAPAALSVVEAGDGT